MPATHITYPTANHFSELAHHLLTFRRNTIRFISIALILVAGILETTDMVLSGVQPGVYEKDSAGAAALMPGSDMCIFPAGQLRRSNVRSYITTACNL